MATTTLKTRISLKYDSLANWMDKNPLLLKGELAIAEVPTAQDSVVSAPAIIFKVGDGEKNFNDLPWASALAADVHAWAKKERPEITVENITDIDSYLTGKGYAAASDLTALDTKVDNFIDTITNGAGTEAIDTFQELLDYVSQHGTDFSVLSGKVNTLEGSTEIEGSVDYKIAQALSGYSKDTYISDLKERAGDTVIFDCGGADI